MTALERDDRPGAYFGITAGSKVTDRVFALSQYQLSEGEDIWIRLRSTSGDIDLSVKRKAFVTRLLRPGRGT